MRLATVIVVVLSCLLLAASHHSPNETGRLSVRVINPGDGLPMTNAQVFTHRMNSESLVLVPKTGRGVFETDLVPGYYDLVVTDATSIPWAKRIEIISAREVKLKAEMLPDMEHLQE